MCKLNFSGKTLGFLVPLQYQELKRQFYVSEFFLTFLLPVLTSHQICQITKFSIDIVIATLVNIINRKHIEYI